MLFKSLIVDTKRKRTKGMKNFLVSFVMKLDEVLMGIKSVTK